MDPRGKDPLPNKASQDEKAAQPTNRAHMSSNVQENARRPPPPPAIPRGLFGRRENAIRRPLPPQRRLFGEFAPSQDRSPVHSAFDASGSVIETSDDSMPRQLYITNFLAGITARTLCRVIEGHGYTVLSIMMYEGYCFVLIMEEDLSMAANAIDGTLLPVIGKYRLMARPSRRRFPATIWPRNQDLHRPKELLPPGLGAPDPPEACTAPIDTLPPELRMIIQDPYEARTLLIENLPHSFANGNAVQDMFEHRQFIIVENVYIHELRLLLGPRLSLCLCVTFPTSIQARKARSRVSGETICGHKLKASLKKDCGWSAARVPASPPREGVTQPGEQPHQQDPVIPSSGNVATNGRNAENPLDHLEQRTESGSFITNPFPSDEPSSPFGTLAPVRNTELLRACGIFDTNPFDDPTLSEKELQLSGSKQQATKSDKRPGESGQQAKESTESEKQVEKPVGLGKWFERWLEEPIYLWPVEEV